MKKNTKIIIIVVVAVVILGVALLIFTSSSADAATPGKGAKKPGVKATAKSSAKSPAKSPSKSTTASEFPFKNGEKNDDILIIQQQLNAYWNQDIAEDGIWGPETSAALQSSLGKSNVNSTDEWNVLVDQLNSAATESDADKGDVPGSSNSPVPDNTEDILGLIIDTSLNPES